MKKLRYIAAVVVLASGVGCSNEEKRAECNKVMQNIIDYSFEAMSAFNNNQANSEFMEDAKKAMQDRQHILIDVCLDNYDKDLNHCILMADNAAAAFTCPGVQTLSKEIEKAFR